MDVELTDVTVEYVSGGYVVRPIDGLTERFPSGELVLLLGASGCGKTTLLSALAGILRPTSGSIRIGDREVTDLRGDALTEHRRRTVGVIFQAFNLIPSLTASENVQLPLRAAGVRGAAARQRALDLLDQVGLEERTHHRPGDLSGGQQQRVAIARALAHDPPVLLADEPTAHLDNVQVEGILSLLRRLATPGRIVVVATHDERLVPLADRIVTLSPLHAEQNHPRLTVTLEPGQVLFKENEVSDRIWVVDEGQIEIVRAGVDGPLARVDPGTYFGELGPLFGIKRTAAARAVVPTTVTGYGVREFRERVGEDAMHRMIAAGGMSTSGARG
jgi:putative ABC transport system ATP-binding protein